MKKILFGIFCRLAAIVMIWVTVMQLVMGCILFIAFTVSLLWIIYWIFTGDYILPYFFKIIENCFEYLCGITNKLLKA